MKFLTKRSEESIFWTYLHLWLSFKVEKPQKFAKFSFHNYSNDNIKTFQTYLANSDLSCILDSNDVEEAAVILDAKINGNRDHFFPLKTVKKHPKFI